ncbi:uncharacterized protein LOC126568902 [Anopheles aquasalis]|uniref:uncharacterized protein LOC126568902 n=1 Tax=Anopheles aquasalis TaxID=42839 RepID=UPI00215B70F9|nr:uncharacterized protein LOC126568902 [Anopheles aquasalis]
MSVDPENGADARDETNYIDKLPAEVLCMIFDLLDLDTIKNASRTSQRWYNIIFTSQYAARFVLNFDVTSKVLAAYPICVEYLGRSSKLHKVYKLQRKVKAQEAIKDVMDMITHSKWCVRNLTYRVDRYSSDDFPALWKTIHPKITANLVSLDLSLTTFLTQRVLPVLAAALPLMQQLGTLNLRHVAREPFVQDGLIILRSSSVENVTFASILNIGIEMPLLRTFTGESNVLFQSGSCTAESQMQPVAFDNLKHLYIVKVKQRWGPTKPNHNVSIPLQVSMILQMKNLETIKWEEVLIDEVFRAICETCLKLKHLWIEKLEISNVRVLDPLSKLVDLHDLKIEEIDTKDQSPLALDFSNQTKLQQVVLPHMNIDSLVLRKSMNTLGFTVSSKTHETMAQILRDYRMQVTELTLNFINFDAHEPTEMMKVLSIMHNLEVLRLRRGCFCELSFFLIPAPMDRLREMHFEDCCLYRATFSGYQDKFPNLEVLTRENKDSDDEDAENYDDESSSNDESENEVEESDSEEEYGY